jgi:NAD(P)-dependent dehydrogenase (short-subunit alcohol dehydrogenase family)
MADTSLALVIGANRGIGLGVAKELLRRGWSVIATARRPTEAADLKTLSLMTRGRLDIRALDMNNTAQTDAVVADLAGRTFDLVLVNGGVAGPEHMSASKATQAEIGALMFTRSRRVDTQGYRRSGVHQLHHGQCRTGFGRLSRAVPRQ